MVEMLALIGVAPRLHPRSGVVCLRGLRPGGIVRGLGKRGVGAERGGEEHGVVLRCLDFPRSLPVALPLATVLVSPPTLSDGEKRDPGSSPGRSEEHTSELQSLMRIS